MSSQSAFSRNIKALRRDAGITQTELAETLNLRSATVSNWEKKGPRPRSPEVIRLLCDFFNCDESDLFGYSDGYYEKRLQRNRKQPASADQSSEPVDNAHHVPSRILERYPAGFVVAVTDDSMNLQIPEGASAYVAETNVESGAIACVSVDGTQLIRRVVIYDEAYILEPLSMNKTLKRQLIDRKDTSAPVVEILGRVVWFEKEL